MEIDQERYPAWICSAVDVHNMGGLRPTDTFVPFALFSLQGGVAHLSGVRTAHLVLSLQKTSAAKFIPSALQVSKN